MTLKRRLLTHRDTHIKGGDDAFLTTDEIIHRLENLSADPTPSTDTIGRIFYNTAEDLVKYDTGSAIKAIGEGLGKRSATRIVAASNALQSSKDGADYVCDGTDDQVEINQAISDLGTTGGVVYLTEGTFNLTDNISIASKVHIVGSGIKSTTIKTGSLAIPLFESLNKSHFSISNIYLDWADSGIRLRGSETNFVVESIHFGTNMYFAISVYYEIDSATIRNVYSNRTLLDYTPTYVECSNVKILHNIVVNATSNYGVPLKGNFHDSFVIGNYINFPNGTGILESAFDSATPDYNIIMFNNVRNCATGITTLGANTLVAHNQEP